MQIKIIYAILIATLFCACATVKWATPRGTYSQVNDTHQFEINADSTFRYKYVIDTFIDIVSEGTWTIKNASTMLLNSYKEPTIAPLTFDRKRTPNSKTARQLHVELISDKGNEHDFFIVPYTNRTVLPDYEKKRGSLFFETAFMIDSVWFKVYKEPVVNKRPKPKEYYQKISLPQKYTAVESEHIELKLHPGESAYITIKIKDDDFSHRTFKNTPLQITASGISFRDSDDNKVYPLNSKK